MNKPNRSVEYRFIGGYIFTVFFDGLNPIGARRYKCEVIAERAGQDFIEHGVIFDERQ